MYAWVHVSDVINKTIKFSLQILQGSGSDVVGADIYSGMVNCFLHVVSGLLGLALKK